MKEEIWKDVPGLEGVYQASNIGRVRSLTRQCWNGKAHHIKLGRILTQYKADSKSTPYYTVRVCCTERGINRHIPVSTLVCEAFHGPRPRDIVGGRNMVCMHLNGNSLDNRAENLAWGTHKDNSSPTSP